MTITGCFWCCFYGGSAASYAPEPWQTRMTTALAERIAGVLLHSGAA